MRWALVLVVVVCGACEPGGTERKPRWPHHRELEEERISELETKLKQLQQQVVELAALDARLRGQLLTQAPVPRPEVERELQLSKTPLKSALRDLGLTEPQPMLDLISAQVRIMIAEQRLRELDATTPAAPPPAAPPPPPAP